MVLLNIKHALNMKVLNDPQMNSENLGAMLYIRKGFYYYIEKEKNENNNNN